MLFKMSPMRCFTKSTEKIIKLWERYFSKDSSGVLDTYALLYVSIDYGMSNIYPNLRNACSTYLFKIIDDNIELFLKNHPEVEKYDFHKRVDFYGEIIRTGNIRGEYGLGFFHKEEQPVLVNMTVGYIDCIQDHDKIDDYDGAPVVISDISEVPILIKMTIDIAQLLQKESIKNIQNLVKFC